jgi:hypothetical protein
MKKIWREEKRRKIENRRAEGLTLFLLLLFTVSDTSILTHITPSLKTNKVFFLTYVELLLPSPSSSACLFRAFTLHWTLVGGTNCIGIVG